MISLGMLDAQQDWTALSACRTSDPDELFVTGAAQNRAKAVCSGCPVRTECLGDALDNRVEFGVWGGMTERERRALLRRRRIHPHDLPRVAVEVEEAARVQEATVLLLIGAVRASDDFIDDRVTTLALCRRPGHSGSRATSPLYPDEKRTAKGGRSRLTSRPRR